MKTFQKLLLLSLVLVISGQGCVLGKKTSTADGGVWRSEDAGDTWTHQVALPTSTGVSTIAGVNATWFEIDPSDTSTYYLGTAANGLFYSLDNATSWVRPKGEEARDGKIVSVEVDPNNVCVVYVLKSDRLLKTIDCHRTYKSILTEARSDEELTTFAVDWFNTNILWAGNTAGDVMKSVDAGTTWTTVYRVRDDITSIAISNTDSRIILIGSKGKGLFRSVDSGGTWTEYEDQLVKEFKESDDVYGFAQSRDGSTLVMNTEYGLLVSHDQGATWSSIPIRTKAGDVRIWSIAVSPQDGNVIYYGTVSTLYVSANGGESWALKDLPCASAPLAFSVHPSSSSYVFLGCAEVEK